MGPSAGVAVTPRDQLRDELRARLAPAAAALVRAKQVRVLGGALRKARDVLRRAATVAGGPVATAASEALQHFDRVATALSPSPELAGDRWALAREVGALREEGVESQRIARTLLDLGVCRKCGGARVSDIGRCQTWMRQDQKRLRDHLATASRQSAGLGFRLASAIRTMDPAAIPASEKESTMPKNDPFITKRTTSTTVIEEQFQNPNSDAELDDLVEPEDEAEDAEDDTDE